MCSIVVAIAGPFLRFLLVFNCCFFSLLHCFVSSSLSLRIVRHRGCYAIPSDANTVPNSVNSDSLSGPQEAAGCFPGRCTLLARPILTRAAFPLFFRGGPRRAETKRTRTTSARHRPQKGPALRALARTTRTSGSAPRINSGKGKGGWEGGG